MTSSAEQEFEITPERSLITDYKKLIEAGGLELKLELSRIEGDNLNSLIELRRFTVQKEIPHLFELIWIIWHYNIFTDNARSTRSRNRDMTFWSSSRTSSWNPMTQTEMPMLYMVKFKKATKKWANYIEIEKGSVETTSNVFFVDSLDQVNRDLPVTDENLDEFMNTRQFPREFFTHHSNWKDFNRFIALMDVNKLLTAAHT